MFYSMQVEFITNSQAAKRYELKISLSQASEFRKKRNEMVLLVNHSYKNS